MSEVQNPFSRPARAPDGSAPGNARAGWIAAVLTTILAILFYVLWTMARIQARETEPLRAQLNDANAKLTNDLTALGQGNNQITNLEAQIADLQQQKEAVGSSAKRLEDEMRSDLESKDVTISNLQGKLTVNILDRVMFDSGASSVKPDGEGVLRKVADLLAKHPKLKIQVIGHTDNIPIHTAYYPSNWELSAARALAAVHFLTEKAGVNPSRVGAVGYGEFRPIADNATPDGRARNRRIAITIMPDELAAGDAAPTAQTNAPIDLPVTNSDATVQ